MEPLIIMWGNTTIVLTELENGYRYEITTFTEPSESIEEFLERSLVQEKHCFGSFAEVWQEIGELIVP